MDTPSQPAETPDESNDATSVSRLQLIWDVFVFQFKLIADGLRDVLLSPVSIISALLGLLAGGDQPDRYFRQVLKLGRRSETWINLFGHRKYARTSDELFEPLKDKVFAEAQSNPWMTKVSDNLNRKLDDVNASVAARKSDVRSTRNTQPPADDSATPER